MDLVGLLCNYPILETLVKHLGLGDFLCLSRTSSTYRAVLHGIPLLSHPDAIISGSTVRKDLRIGDADTALWKHLKASSEMVCSETRHTKGNTPKGCRICSMPICTACVVKASFGKNENTFVNRRRRLCDVCWASGNPHDGRLRFAADTTVLLNYYRMSFCRCRANDGYLCSRCMPALHQDSSSKEVQLCQGRSCQNKIGNEEDLGGRVCVWCDLRLPGGKLPSSQKFDHKSRRAYEIDFATEISPKSRNTNTSSLGRDRMSYDDQIYWRANPPGTVRRTDSSSHAPAVASDAPPYSAILRSDQAET